MSYKFDNTEQADRVLELGLGRILKLGSRPFQDGDIEQYETVKSVMLDAFDYLGISATDTSANYARDYHKIYHD